MNGRSLLAVLAAVFLAGVALWLFRRGPEPESPDRRPMEERRESSPRGDPAPAASAPRPADRPKGEASRPRSPEKPFEEIARDILGRHREAREQDQGRRTPLPRFQEESLFHYREARLLALTHPEKAEAFAAALAQDGSAPPGDRDFAVYMLHVLARAGRKSAGTVLYGLASGSNGPLASLALGSLAEADPQGSHRALYWSRSDEGSEAAVEALGRWADPGTTARLQKHLQIPPGAPYPAGQLRATAETALRRVEQLSSAAAEDHVVAAIKTVKEHKVADLFWAISVARQSRSPRVLDAMRERLDAGYSGAELRVAVRTTLEPSEPVESLIANSPTFATLTGDLHHDEVLVALWELGGKLQPREQARLRTFGYGNDPAERLRELIDEPRR